MTKLASIDEGTVRKAYARWEPVYDLVFGNCWPSGRRQAIDVINRLEGSVLEVGVGTGISLPQYRPHLGSPVSICRLRCWPRRASGWSGTVSTMSRRLKWTPPT